MPPQLRSSKRTNNDLDTEAKTVAPPKRPKKVVTIEEPKKTTSKKTTAATEPAKKPTKAPAKAPAKTTTKAPAKAPAKSRAKQPAKQPTEENAAPEPTVKEAEPIESAAPEVVEKPKRAARTTKKTPAADEPAEKPAKAPARTRAKPLAEKPAPAEPASEDDAEPMDVEPTQVVEKPKRGGRAAAKAPVKTTAKAPAKAPAKTSAKAAPKPAEEKPAEEIEKKVDDAPEDVPKEAPAKAPAKSRAKQSAKQPAQEDAAPEAPAKKDDQPIEPSAPEVVEKPKRGARATKRTAVAEEPVEKPPAKASARTRAKPAAEKPATEAVVENEVESMEVAPSQVADKPKRAGRAAAKAPVKTTAKAPAKAPAKASAKAAPKPAEEKPAEEIEEKVDDAPEDVPKEAPAKAPAKSRAKQPAEQPTEENAAPEPAVKDAEPIESAAPEPAEEKPAEEKPAEEIEKKVDDASKTIEQECTAEVDSTTYGDVIQVPNHQVNETYVKIEASKSPDEKKEKVKEKIARVTLTDLHGDVYACGSESALGFGVEDVEKKRPTLIPSLNRNGFCSIVCGSMHSVAISSDGLNVYTFGVNDEYALGRETDVDPGKEDPDATEYITEQSLAAQPTVVTLPPVVKITAGDSHTAALTKDGDLMLCGCFRSQDGKVGLFPDTAPVPEKQFRKVDSNNLSISDIASGDNHLLILTDDGYVYSMGVGSNGQLGRLDNDNCEIHKDLSNLKSFLTLDRVKLPDDVSCDRIWATAHGSFARTINGDLYAWGLNNFSQLGLPTDLDEEGEKVVSNHHARLVPSFSASPVISVAGGLRHALALTQDGKLYSTGSSQYGSLGLGSKVKEVDHFTQINALKDEVVVSIACNVDGSFAVTQSGDLYSFGMAGPAMGHSSAESDGEDQCEPKLVTCKRLVQEPQQFYIVSAGAMHMMTIAKPRGATNGNGNGN